MFSLFKTQGALPFYLAVLLNAIIDLGHKITLQNTIFKVHDQGEQVALTAIVNALILLPYVLFFLPIGAAANRMPKPQMMRIAAGLTVVLLLALVVFYALGWFWAAFATTFLMSTQSAFYSPAKLGYLKILFGPMRITQANGLAQSVVIIGILMGTVLFSVGFEALFGAATAAGGVPGLLEAGKGSVLAHMWPLALVLMSLALLQLWLVYRVPRLPEELAGEPEVDKGAQPLMGWQLLSRTDFRIPMLGLALFWSLGQGVLAVFPALAKAEAGITNTAVIQTVMTCTGLGILLGAWLVSRLAQRNKGVDLRLPMIGMAVMMPLLFSLTLVTQPLLYALLYLLLGIASGLLIVPLNAWLQMRAAGDAIGGVISTSNLLQNLAMLAVLGVTLLAAVAGIESLELILGMGVAGILAAAYLLPAIHRLAARA